MSGLTFGFARNCACVLGFGIAAAAVCFDIEIAQPYTLPKELWAALVPALLLCALLMRTAIARRSLSCPRELWLAGLFAVFAMATLQWARSPAAGVSAALLSLQNVVWIALGAWVLKESTARKAFLLGLTSGGLATSILGLLQWLHWDSVLLGTFAERFAGLPQVDRPAATFGHVNMAAEAALCGFWGALGLVIQGQAGRAFKALGWCGAILTSVFLIVAGSRAAWIGAALGAVVFASLWLRSLDGDQRRRAGIKLACGAACLVMLLMAIDPAVRVPGRGGSAGVHPSDRVLDLFSLDSGTERERLVLWQNSLAMCASAPFLGIGAGNWSVAYPAFARAVAVLNPKAYNLQRQPEAAHMEALQLLCETGIVGFMLMAAVFLSALAEGWRRGMELVPLLALVVAVLGASIAAYVFQNPVPAAAAFMSLGALVAAPLRQRRGDVQINNVWSIALLAVCVTVLLALAWHARVEASRMLQQGRTARLSLQLTEPSALRLLRIQTLDAMDRALTRRPGDYQLHAERALALWDLGLNDQALDAFDRVLALNPDFVNGLLLKAVLLQGRDELPSAYELLRRAILIQPHSPELRYALGQVFESWARRAPNENPLHLHAALAQYRQAAAAREFMPLARLALARLLLDSGGDPVEVVGLLTKAEENAVLLPDLLAVCARLAGHPRLLATAPGLYGPGGARTQVLWRRIVSLAPNHSEALLEMTLAPLHGFVTPSSEQVSQMLAVIEAQSVTEARSPLLHYYRARVLELAGRAHEALQEWTLILRAGVEEWQSHPRTHLMMEEALEAVQRLGGRVR